MVDVQLSLLLLTGMHVALGAKKFQPVSPVKGKAGQSAQSLKVHPLPEGGGSPLSSANGAAGGGVTDLDNIAAISASRSPTSKPKAVLDFEAFMKGSNKAADGNGPASVSSPAATGASASAGRDSWVDEDARAVRGVTMGIV